MDFQKAYNVKKLQYYEAQVNFSSACKRNKKQHTKGDTMLLCKVIM